MYCSKEANTTPPEKPTREKRGRLPVQKVRMPSLVRMVLAQSNVFLYLCASNPAVRCRSAE